MTPLEAAYDQLLPLFTQAARSVHRRHPQVDFEDLRMEAIEWCLRHPRKLEEYLSEGRDGTRKLVTAMANRAKDYARRDRRDRLGYNLEDEHFYKKADLESLLLSVFDDDAWLKPPTPECTCKTPRCHCDPQIKRLGDPAEGNNWLTTLCDVSAALKLLSREAQFLITLRFKERWTVAKIADHMEVSDRTVGRRIDSAIRQLQDKLGGSRPYKDPDEASWEDYVATRRVMSNAQARALTTNQYK